MKTASPSGSTLTSVNKNPRKFRGFLFISFVCHSSNKIQDNGRASIRYWGRESQCHANYLHIQSFSPIMFPDFPCNRGSNSLYMLLLQYGHPAIALLSALIKDDAEKFRIVFITSQMVMLPRESMVNLWDTVLKAPLYQFAPKGDQRRFCQNVHRRLFVYRWDDVSSNW